MITPVKCDNPGCACTNCRCCVRKKLESTEMGATSDGLSSLMWNADGREMEIEVVECAKVRCDEDDVNGVALGIADEEAELERWLGELMLDDAEDKVLTVGCHALKWTRVCVTTPPIKTGQRIANLWTHRCLRRRRSALDWWSTKAWTRRCLRRS